MPSYSTQDASINKMQLVKAYDPSGNFLGIIGDAPYLTGITDAVGAATTAHTAKLPRKIDAYDGAGQPGSAGTVASGNIWKWYMYGPGLPATGLLRYQGIIDAIAPAIDASGGESVSVTITPYNAILGDHSIVGPIAFGTSGVTSTYVDTMAMFNAWFNGSQLDPGTSLAYGSPFTLDPANLLATGNRAMFSYQNQTLLAALNNVLLLSPANWYFRLNNTNLLATFKQYSIAAPNHYLKIGQHFSQISYAVDNTPRKNVILIQGAGSIQAVARGASVATIGPRSYMKQDSRITDQNTANLLAAGLLAFYDRPQVRAKVTIPDYRGDRLPGLGYDIELFQPGQTVVILDSKASATTSTGPASTWGQFVWGRDKWGGLSQTPTVWGQFTWGQAAWGTTPGAIFNTIVPIVAVTYNYHSVELELGFRQPSILRALYALEAQFNDTTLIS